MGNVLIQPENHLNIKGAVRITNTTRTKGQQITSMGFAPLSNAIPIKALIAPGLVPR